MTVDEPTESEKSALKEANKEALFEIKMAHYKKLQDIHIRFLDAKFKWEISSNEIQASEASTRTMQLFSQKEGQRE